jgi:hypothetical protein
MLLVIFGFGANVGTTTEKKNKFSLSLVIIPMGFISEKRV